MAIARAAAWIAGHASAGRRPTSASSSAVRERPLTATVPGGEAVTMSGHVIGDLPPHGGDRAEAECGQVHGGSSVDGTVNQSGQLAPLVFTARARQA
jgi:hypothetical protein